MINPTQPLLGPLKDPRAHFWPVRTPLDFLGLTSLTVEGSFLTLIVILLVGLLKVFLIVGRHP